MNSDRDSGDELCGVIKLLNLDMEICTSNETIDDTICNNCDKNYDDDDDNSTTDDRQVILPTNPSDWNESHVQAWLTWCGRKFSIEHLPSPDELPSNGKELLDISYDKWKCLPGGKLLARHLGYLHLQATGIHLPKLLQEESMNERYNLFQRTCALIGSTGNVGNSGAVGGGQVQLWQFLLELLSESSNSSCIAWDGNNGEFKLTDPEEVARRWGERKSKPNMNYDKLSRALRYYYDKNIMTKVHGKRYAYKFDFHGLMMACQAQAGVSFESSTSSSISSPARHLYSPASTNTNVVSILRPETTSQSSTSPSTSTHYCWPYPQYSPPP